MSRSLRPPTAADVALRAGVSRATVSHIFNGREGRFPEETRARVRAAAEQLDYRPSPAGRSLVTGRSDTIVVVMPETTFGQNLQNALDRLADDAVGIGANVLMRFAGADPEKTVTALLKLRPCAVVDFGALDGTARDRLRTQGVPTVPRLRGSLREPFASPNNDIGELQVAELTRSGERQIAYAAVCDGRADPYGSGRYAGVRTACARRNLAEPPLVRVSANLESATAALRQLPQGMPLGIAAYNDQVALALLAAGARLRLRVPTDLAVTGVDATDVGQLWTPRLTTIAVDMRAFVDDVIAELAEAIGHPVVDERKPDRKLLRVVSGETT
ncbi:LacI family DNA-binding transcriptional regulator [Streptomyces sp. NPDC096094]|uniref:LacI family DNA-binding transcriptional regulator n=1 Tax=Streptomyces sp. NPDC096094 TaxID=3366073 RepID=UPI00381B33E1